MPAAAHESRPPVVAREEWLAARRALLAAEKQVTRASDELARQRRALPWVRVEEDYVFTGPRGPETLADLFAGRSQLIVKHFMLGPGWEEGCVGCSFEADHMAAALVHLENHDVSLVAVARAPYPEIAAFHRRMGWPFRWVSSAGSPFNYDFGVSFRREEAERDGVLYNYERRPFQGGEDASGLSIFFKDEDGAVFHTYSTFGRGTEKTLAAYMLLDLTPRGRDENGPHFSLVDWVRHHDRYGAGGHVDAGGRYRAEDGQAGCCHAEGEG